MPVDTELLLVLALAAFFLKDALLLLEPDEAVLVQGWRGRWRAGFGARHYALGGRHPWLAHPLLPHEPVVRLRWSMSGAPAAASARPVDVPPALRALQPFALTTWMLLFVTFPVALLGHVRHDVLFTVVGAIYACIVASLTLVYRRRDAFGLDGRGFAALAGELLLCPPLAANLVRRLSLRGAFDEDFAVAATRLLPPEALEAVHRACDARIEDALELVDAGSPRASALAAGRRRFQHEGSDDAR
jgi:hypothetical protein